MKPVHPILVHFPIALLTVSVAADAVGHFGDVESLRHTGAWTLLGAALGGVAAVAAGIYDMRRAPLDEAVHPRVHVHMRVGLALLSAILAMAAWRWRLLSAGTAIVPMAYLDCGVLVVALAAFQGWLGGELVYTHGVFVRTNTRAGAEDGKAPSGDVHEHHH